MRVDIESISARLAAAPGGPWGSAVQPHPCDDVDSTIGTYYTWEVFENHGVDGEIVVDGNAVDDPTSIVNFIAHAPTDLAALLKVARAAELFARCFAPIVDESTKTTVGPCGHCSGCKLASAIEPLAEVLSAKAETE